MTSPQVESSVVGRTRSASSKRQSVSVIIPCYNRAELIGATIQNLLDQTLCPQQIIVVDDGSTDDSAAVVRSFGARVLLIQQPNAGPGAARNAGLAVATGRFLQFFDSDDLASLNKLETQAAALDDSDADFAYCPWVRAQISDKKLAFSGPVLQGGPVPGWKSMLEWQMGSWCLIFQNCMFRREVVDRVGRFRTDLMPTEDSEFLVRILLAGARPVFTSGCLVFYRVHKHQQITGLGLSKQQRSDDWSRYLGIVGDGVEPYLDRMHPSTQREIALGFYRHLRSCRRYGWREPCADTPFSRLTNSIPRLQIFGADLWDRLTRKLRRLAPETPNSLALSLRPPGEQERTLAAQANFRVV